MRCLRKLTLTIWRDGYAHTQDYTDGVPDFPLKRLDKTDKKGTEVRFYPSDEIFTGTIFDYDILAKRLRELSFLNSGVRIVLTDERDGTQHIFEHKGGLGEFVGYINDGKQTLNDIFHFTAQSTDGIGVEVALQWSDSYNEKVLCFTKQHSPTRRWHALIRLSLGSDSLSKRLYGQRKHRQKRKSGGNGR